MENQNRFDGSTDTFNRNVQDRVDRTAASAHDAVNRAASAADNAADKMQERLDRVTSGAHDAVNRAAGMAADMAERMDEKRQQLNQVKDEWLEITQNYVQQKPIKALLIALASGFVLSRLL